MSDQPTFIMEKIIGYWEAPNGERSPGEVLLPQGSKMSIDIKDPATENKEWCEFCDTYVDDLRAHQQKEPGCIPF